MATQMQLARQGIITEAMLQVAAQEQLAPEVIRAGVAAGTIAVCCNINHKNLVPRGVGRQRQMCIRDRCRSGLGSQGQCQYRYFQRLS